MLFETIKIKNKKIFNLSFHKKRMFKSSKDLFNKEIDLNFEKLIQIKDNKTYRCKIIYDTKIKKIEIKPYKLNLVKTLKIVRSPITYPYKFVNRENIEKLLLKKDNFDDILIIKNDLIKDSSKANIAFYDGQRWFTPKEPLLYGTFREKLIQKGFLNPINILEKDIKKYEKFALMNALTGIYELDISCIKGI